MRKSRTAVERDLWKGLLAGMIGGAFGSWMMNQYQHGIQKVVKTWKENDPRLPAESESKQHSNANGNSDDATMRMAELLSEKVMHRQLTRTEKKKAGSVIHYAYGVLAGGVYGAAAEWLPSVRKGAGTYYATALFVGGDEVAVPRLNLSEPLDKYPLSVHVNALASHLVYGLSTELGRKVARAVL